VSQHLSVLLSGKATEGRSGSEPDPGNPAVRDRRGACGNVTITGAGLRANGKLLEHPPDPKMVRAPLFYPDRPRPTNERVGVLVSSRLSQELAPFGIQKCLSIRQGRSAGRQFRAPQLRHGLELLLPFERVCGWQRHCRLQSMLGGARQGRHALRVALFGVELEGSSCVGHGSHIWRCCSVGMHGGSSGTSPPCSPGAQHVIEPGPAESVALSAPVASLSAVAAEAVVLSSRRAG